MLCSAIENWPWKWKKCKFLGKCEKSVWNIRKNCFSRIHQWPKLDFRLNAFLKIFNLKGNFIQVWHPWLYCNQKGESLNEHGVDSIPTRFFKGWKNLLHHLFFQIQFDLSNHPLFIHYVSKITSNESFRNFLTIVAFIYPFFHTCSRAFDSNLIFWDF